MGGMIMAVAPAFATCKASAVQCHPLTAHLSCSLDHRAVQQLFVIDCLSICTHTQHGLNSCALSSCAGMVIAMICAGSAMDSGCRVHHLGGGRADCCHGSHPVW